MRQFFLILIIATSSPTLLWAQKDTIITFTEIVSAESVSKEQLFQNARKWYNETFNSSKDVLQIVDKETGELSGKGLLKSWYDFKVLGTEKKYSFYYRFSIDIKVKEGKYRYAFSNFTVDETTPSGLSPISLMTSADKCPVKFSMVNERKADALYASMKKHLADEAKLLVLSLKLKMTRSTKDDF